MTSDAPLPPHAAPDGSSGTQHRPAGTSPGAQDVAFEVAVAMEVVYERSLSPLGGVVEQASEAVSASMGPVPDVSPRGTADRLLKVVVNRVFPAFQKQHHELADWEARGAFVDSIYGPMMQGFEDACSMLDAFQLLSSDVKAGIQEVRTRVECGLEEFVNVEENTA